MIEEIRLLSAIHPTLEGISDLSKEITLVSPLSREMLLVSKVFPELEAVSQIDLEEV